MRPLRQAHPRRWSEAPAGDLRCPGDRSRRHPRPRRPQEGGAGGEGPGEEAGGGREDRRRRRSAPAGKNARARRPAAKKAPAKGAGQASGGKAGAGNPPPAEAAPRPRPRAGDAAAGGRARARRRDRRRRAHRLLLRLLAGPSGLGRRGRREEGVPPREDLRGRPHATGRPAAGRHGPGGGPGRFPPLRGPTRLRVRPLHRHALAGAPELPRLRLHHHAPRPRRAGRRARGGGGGHPAPGHRGDGASRRRDRPALGPTADAHRCHGQGEGSGEHPHHPWPLRRGGRRIQFAGGPHARHDTAPGPAHGHGPARLLPVRPPRRPASSSRTSTSATPRATWSPGTAGSSPWATAG